MGPRTCTCTCTFTDTCYCKLVHVLMTPSYLIFFSKIKDGSHNTKVHGTTTIVEVMIQGVHKQCRVRDGVKN